MAVAVRAVAQRSAQRLDFIGVGRFYFVSVKNAPCRPKRRARRPIVVFTTKLMKKPLCAMPLRYVRVVLNYQEESPPISHWDRVVIPLGWAVALCDFGGAV